MISDTGKWLRCFSSFFSLSFAFSSFICSMAVLVYNNSNTIKPFLRPFSAKTCSPTRVTSNQLLSDVKTFGSHNHYGLWIFFWQWENTLIKYFGCFGEWWLHWWCLRENKRQKSMATYLMYERRDDFSRTHPPAAIFHWIAIFQEVSKSHTETHTHTHTRSLGFDVFAFSLHCKDFTNNYDHLEIFGLMITRFCIQKCTSVLSKF